MRSALVQTPRVYLCQCWLTALHRGIGTPIGKQKPREGKTPVQGHTAGEELSFGSRKSTVPASILLPSLMGAQDSQTSGQLRQPHGPNFPGHSWFHNHPSFSHLEPPTCPRNCHVSAVSHTQGQPRTSARRHGPVSGWSIKLDGKGGGGAMPSLNTIFSGSFHQKMKRKTHTQPMESTVKSCVPQTNYQLSLGDGPPISFS